MIDYKGNRPVWKGKAEERRKRILKKKQKITT